MTTPYGSSPATSSYTTNNLNQYTAVGGTSRSHDGNGNVADDATYTYEYNYKNLICRVKQGSTTIGEYRYDALGRRVEKVVTGATYRYIYSGLETVCVYTTTGTWKQDFVYDAGIDGIVMLQQADVLDQDGDANTSETTRSFYHRNALGSVMEITDMSQHEAVSYRYDPYGQITITRGGTPQSGDPLGQFITYASRWIDEETRCLYVRTRHQCVSIGRFIQCDPTGLRAGANLYEYAQSGPTTWTDPLGLAPHTPEQAAFYERAREASQRSSSTPLSYGDCMFYYGSAVTLKIMPCHPPQRHAGRNAGAAGSRLHVKIGNLYIFCQDPPTATATRSPVPGPTPPPAPQPPPATSVPATTTPPASAAGAPGAAVAPAPPSPPDPVKEVVRTLDWMAEHMFERIDWIWKKEAPRYSVWTDSEARMYGVPLPEPGGVCPPLGARPVAPLRLPFGLRFPLPIFPW